MPSRDRAAPPASPRRRVAQRHPAASEARGVPPLTPHLFPPTRVRPMRAKRTFHAADSHVVPHAHPWAQLTYSATGVIRLTAERATFLVPPSRAVWIPPGVEHVVNAVESCELRTAYFFQGEGCGPLAAIGAAAAAVASASRWQHCRVIEVTDLLRALLLALPTASDAEAPPAPGELQREQRITALVADELDRARPVPLGLPLPQDKRLRALCEAMLDDPGRHTTLAGWAADAGASTRTLVRLFRSELDTSFALWRQQALLARAMTLAARGHSMHRIAADLGYASASAFSAMVRRTLGAPPSRLFTAAG